MDIREDYFTDVKPEDLPAEVDRMLNEIATALSEDFTPDQAKTIFASLLAMTVNADHIKTVINLSLEKFNEDGDSADD